MKKIPTLFKRGDKSENYLVLPELTIGCEWVLEGKGLCTIKIDGVNVKITLVPEDALHPNGRKLMKRLKPSDGEYSEASYIPCAVDRSDPSEKYLWEAFDSQEYPMEGIHEAFGPGINGNPQNVDSCRMVKVAPVEGVLLLHNNASGIKRGTGITVKELYDSLRDELFRSDCEGVVFHFEEPSMNPVKFAKIKRRDFGFPWPIKV